MKPEFSKKELNVKKLQKQIDELTEKVELLEKEKAETFDKLQRISADYANFQKRTPKQIADSVAYEKKSIISSILPSLDNFTHALEAGKNIEGDARNIIDGVQMVFDHMLDALKSHGVEIIESVGQEFNPMFHEAVMQRAEEDKPNGIVLEEFQKGYTMNGQSLRSAKVIVNKLPEQAQPEQAQEQTDTDQSPSENNTDSED